MRRVCQVAIVLIAAAPAVAQPPDVRTIVRQSIQNYDKSWRAAMQWSYTQTDVTYADGKREVDVSSVIPLEGTPYERLLTKDGRALTPDDHLAVVIRRVPARNHHPVEIRCARLIV